MNNIKEFRELDSKSIVEQINKRKQQIIDETAKLANQGRKNSNLTIKTRKEIARLETILNEKIIESFKETNNG